MTFRVLDDSAFPPEGSGALISEQDLAIIDALQTAPRAPWARLAPAIGIDASTAARRWERLRADGSAWLTGYVSARVATVAYVEVRCSPSAIDAVSAAVTELPWAYCVDETAGDFDLLVSVGAPDLATLGRLVRDGVGSLPGVLSLRILVGLTLFGEGGDWRMRALEPARRAELSTSGPSTRTGFVAHGPARLSEQDLALVAALHSDARMTYAELGSRAGVSEPTARRRVERMVREGDIVLRCDFAYAPAGLTTLMVYGMSTPQEQLPATAAALAGMEQVRFCAAVTGRHPLMVHVLLPGLSAVGPFESLLAERFPQLAIEDRAVVVRSTKRMGWLLDEYGRGVGRIPLWPSDI